MTYIGLIFRSDGRLPHSHGWGSFLAKREDLNESDCERERDERRLRRKKRSRVCEQARSIAAERTQGDDACEVRRREAARKNLSISAQRNLKRTQGMARVWFRFFFFAFGRKVMDDFECRSMPSKSFVRFAYKIHTQYRNSFSSHYK